jgi:hypothetical protein
MLIPFATVGLIWFEKTQGTIGSAEKAESLRILNASDFKVGFGKKGEADHARKPIDGGLKQTTLQP